MLQVPFAQFAVQRTNLLLLPLGERMPVGPGREVHEGVEMARLGVNQPLPKSRSPFVEGLPQRFKHLRVGVLRGVFDQLSEGIYQRQRVVADVVQLVPEPVEPALLRLIEHQPAQMVVLAIEEGERHDLIHGNDFGVAEGSGEQLAEFVKCRLNSLSSRAAFIN